MGSVIVVKNLKKSYPIERDKKVEILKDMSFEIADGDFCIIFGPSGSGKSTLLHHLAGLEMPSSGDIIVNGVNIAKFNQEERAVFRAKSFGMVYQIWYWVKSLVVWENVALPLLIAGEEEAVAKQKALDCLREVGMQDYANKRPMQLSGGEQQRVGLARALVNNPRIIIADEPTGNLDTHSADEMIQLLQFLNTKQKRTIIMVTHNLAYLPLATREIGVKDGLIVSRGSEVRELVKEELKGVL